jgi:uroporphyrin-III C-methyltransferase
MRGFVSLVGAGPGDPELLTVKGLRRLRAADTVVYDALIGAELLRECRADAELIDVGKRAGQPSPSQSSINAVLIARARAGQLVVRLKGGDPFVFGRGGEEADALQAAGVPWEVVPGISSAIGVAAYAGIPVTHRGLASSFAVVTGHPAEGHGPTRSDLAGLARSVDTLVVLMGVGRLAEIAADLLAGGRAPITPAAVIRWGTTAEQEIVVGSLATIADDVARAGLGAPATLVVGEVVRLRERLRWFDVLVPNGGLGASPSEGIPSQPVELHRSTRTCAQ